MPSTKCGWDSVPGGPSGDDLLVFWGPLLFVDVGFDPNYKAVPDSPPPVPGRTNLPALFDTGATESCIDSLLAAQLNLPVVDKRLQAGAHGAKEVAIHLAQIHIPSLGQTIYGGFAAVDLRMGVNR